MLLWRFGDGFVDYFIIQGCFCFLYFFSCDQIFGVNGFGELVGLFCRVEGFIKYINLVGIEIRKDCKMIGKIVFEFLQWCFEVEFVMEEIIDVKVSQFLEMKKLFLLFKFSVIFVYFVYDWYWGFGLDVDKILYINFDVWFGRNVFGKIIK